MDDKIESVKENYLSIADPLEIDESVAEFKYDIHSPTPGSDLNHNSQIKILVVDQSAYYLPFKSYLTLKGNFTKDDGTKLIDANLVTLTNNSPMFLFDKIEYLIGDTTVESINYPGHASLMKGMFAYPKNFGECGGINLGWENDYDPEDQEELSLEKRSGFKERHLRFNKKSKYNVSFIIPLGHIFGFCDEYRKMIFGLRHTLILNRCGNKNAIVKGANTAPDCVFNITDLTWTIPRILPSIDIDMKLTNLFNSKGTYPIGFLYRNLDSISVPQSTTFTWPLGLKSSTEKPRYFIIGFQTNKSQNYLNAGVFDHCDLKTISVYLNAVQYPNISIVNNFATEDFSLSYYHAKQFRENYYKLSEHFNDFMITVADYKKYYPLFVIDTSKQSDRVKNSISDVRIVAEFRQPVPANTICYCLVLSDRMMKMVCDGSKVLLEY